MSIIDRAGIRVKHQDEAITVAEDGSQRDLADGVLDRTCGTGATPVALPFCDSFGNRRRLRYPGWTR